MSVGGRIAVVPMPVSVRMRQGVFIVVNVRVHRLGRRRKPARLAGERQEPHPEHVKRRQDRADGRKHEQQEMLGALADPRQRRRQDRILRVKPAEKRHARDRQRSDQHRVAGARHLLEQAAQDRHLVGVNAVINAAGAQEQKGLEERMGDQVKEPGRPAADPQAEHHESELADRRISKHFLVVGLHHRDRRRDEQRDPAGVRDVQAARRR